MGTNENVKKKSFSKAIIIVVVLVLIVLGFGFAYARYITRLNGSTQVPIAQWNFKVTAGSSQSLDIDLSGTRFLDDTTEVDRTKVAPGTAGALQFNINATGSQVSLEYTIDLTLTQIPENLIFYSDSEMTKALYNDNGVIHLDGYFGANDNNKTATKNLYWRWKLETGSTQAEIDANDLLDSEWIGDRIVLGVQATGRQVTDSPMTQYAVTFDLNGGTLANHGDSTQITKNVTYGEQYGALPEPTREGYTFKGWNGKNQFDKTKYLYLDDYPEYFSTTYHSAKIFLKPNTTYKVSIKRYNNFDGKSNGYLLIADKKEINNGTWSSIAHRTSPNSSSVNYLYTTKNDGLLYIGYADASQSNLDTIWANTDVLIEEGTIATTYEHYIISESTLVTQNKNHTITAIWEKDE